MQKWRSITVLSFYIFTLLMGVFYIVAGGLFMSSDKYTLDYQNAKRIIWEITIFLIVVGVCTLITAILSLMWYFKITFGDKSQIILATIIFDTIFSAFYLSTTVASAIITSVFHTMFKQPVSSEWAYPSFSKIFSVGIALGICSLIGFLLTIFINFIRMQPFARQNQSLPEFSMTDIK